MVFFDARWSWQQRIDVCYEEIWSHPCVQVLKSLLRFGVHRLSICTLSHSHSAFLDTHILKIKHTWANSARDFIQYSNHFPVQRLFTFFSHVHKYVNGLEIWEYGRRDPSRWPRDTLYPQKLTLTSPTRGGRSVCIVRSRTQATEIFSQTYRTRFKISHFVPL
jgi:hypothetical protein